MVAPTGVPVGTGCPLTKQLWGGDGDQSTALQAGGVGKLEASNDRMNQGEFTAVCSHCEAGGTGFLTIPPQGWSSLQPQGESFILVLFPCVRCVGLQVPPLETCCLAQSLCVRELGF